MIMAIVPLIIMGIVVTNISKESVRSEIHDKANIIVHDLSDNVDLFVEQNKNLLAFLGATRTLKDLNNQDTISLFLYEAIQHNPQIVSIFIGNRDNQTAFAVPYTALPSNVNLNNETWYTDALKAKGSVVSDVTIDPKLNNPVISISDVILSDIGEPIGVICANVSLFNLTGIVQNTKLGEEGLAFITDKEGTVIAHKEYKLVVENANFSEYEFVQKALNGESGFTIYKDENGREQFLVYDYYDPLGLGIFIQQPVDEAFVHINTITQSIIGLSIVVIILCVILSSFLGRIITKPISQLLSLTESVANNDLTKSLQIKDKTEIGALANSFNTMTSNLKELVQEVIIAAENLSASAEELASGAEQSSLSSQQVADAVEQIAQGATEQAKKLEEISEVVNQLVISNGNVEESTNATNSAAENMKQNAIESQKKMRLSKDKMDIIKTTVEQSNQIMGELDVKLREISDITAIIGEIVDQTNLLALNASIEAARAGEHGRGFAIVADEVRKLAEQSGQAAKQISHIAKTILSNSQNAVDSMAESIKEVDEGENLILEINDQIDTLMKDINVVAERSQNISKELSEQYNHIDNIVTMVQDISSISEETAAGTEEVSASAEEQTATMESISASSQDLAKLAENLSLLVNKFKV